MTRYDHGPAVGLHGLTGGATGTRRACGLGELAVGACLSGRNALRRSHHLPQELGHVVTAQRHVVEWLRLAAEVRHDVSEPQSLRRARLRLEPGSLELC